MNFKLGDTIFWTLIVITIVIFLFSIVMALINRGSQQSYELLKPLLGGTFVAIFIWIGIYFSPIKKFSEQTNVLVVSKENGEIVNLKELTIKKFGVGPDQGYLFLNRDIVSYLQSYYKNNTSLDLDSYLLDLLEWATLNWISQNYPNHWQIEREYFELINGGGAGNFKYQEGAEKDPSHFYITKILAGNKFADFYKETNIQQVFLPKNTQVIYKNHGINFVNKYINARISFSIGTKGQLAVTDMSNVLIEKFGPAWNYQIRVIFTVTPNEVRRWSPETEKQIEWFEVLSSLYKRDFDWANLKPKVEQSLNINAMMTGE